MSTIIAGTIQTTSGGPITLTGQTAGKAYCSFTGLTTTTINESFSTSSVTDNGTGDTTITWSVTFTNEKYLPIGSWQPVEDPSALQQRCTEIDDMTTSFCRVESSSTSSAANIDLYGNSWVAFGDLA